MEAISGIFGGITILWFYAVFVGIPAMALIYALAYFVRGPKESLAMLFWVLFPYLVAAIVAMIISPFTGIWGLPIVIYVWLKASIFALKFDKDKVISEKRDENS